ncbi:hypothetical protein [Pseudoalteromonas luteoviolacea]|uniref:Uncharacterized protein n=1 Tax=Pseudoalteromonas luteoviolacea H33 TaxID=1365251 RepID=A0A167E4R1_9GAMM|nr:hypothetical protein [Pseudoalteromonas luteoviolacea]KZN50040.1 hypothetical protein N476_16975 [Pseudoalteromonas luteoviolacea H33]KZN76386.1 hypothetical protein N477_16910 [Pseudoalteromonas luteoviolacea H33-S]MBQ4877779.1 hypothetical protein [Pseudoalteromonas luteoviolacea]MBQ4906775.1 hypothetical protein [Pseudoalteromonas luteoviolacea]
MKIIVSIFFTAIITAFFTMSYLKIDSQSSASHSVRKSDPEHKLESDLNSEQTLANNINSQASTRGDIDSLIETQTALLNTLKNMNNRLTEVENRLNLLEPQAMPSTQSLARPIPQAQLQAAISDSNARQDFMQAENSFYSQGHDPAWDAHMTSALEDVETVLRGTFDDSVQISAQECRSDSCRVEFSLEQDDISLHPLMLAAQGSSKMFFDEQVINGQKKTIVIYQR